MNKFGKFLLLLIPFIFALSSCVNLIDEQYGSDISFAMTREVSDVITKDINNNLANESEKEIEISCILYNEKNTQVTSNTIKTNLASLPEARISLTRIPLGSGYSLVVNISCNGHIIYTGKSSEKFSVTNGAVLRPPVSLNKKVSKITYELNGGLFNDNKGNIDEYTFDGKTLLRIPESNGKKFLGWYTSPSFNGTPLDKNLPLGKNNYYGDITLYAKWHNSSFTISYETGISETKKPTIVEEGYTLSQNDLAPLTSNDGRVFKGWYIQDEKMHVGDPVVEDITLVAKWSNKGTVDEVRFTPSMTTNNTLDYGDKVLLSCDTENATIYYTLDNKSPINNVDRIPYDKPIVIEGDTVIKAYAECTGLIPSSETSSSYQMKLYTVSFDTLGTTRKLKKGDKLSDLPIPTKTTDEFIGWQYKGSDINNGYIVTQDMLLTPLWRAQNAVRNVTYTIPSGAIDKGTYVELLSSEGANIYYTTDNSDPRTSTTRTLYSSPILFSDITELNIKAYAEKEGLMPSNTTSTSYTMKTYKVTLDTKGIGTKPSNVEDIRYKKGDKISLSSLTQEGYDFISWIDNNGNEVKGEYEVVRDTVITANWKARTININYNLDATIKNDNPTSITIEDTFTLIDVRKDGYNFDGWYTSSKFEEQAKITSIAQGQKTDINIYPKFTEIPYTITYVYVDTINLPSTYNVNTPTIILTSPTKDGFTFNGWFLDANCETKNIKSIEKGTTGNLVLYAKWTIQGRVQDVTFSNANTYLDKGDEIRLNCNEINSTIYYTLDGSSPITNKASRLTYDETKPIILNQDTLQIKAYAEKEGMIPSNETSTTYKMQKYTVSFNSNGHGTAPDTVTGLRKGDVIPAASLQPLSAKGYKFDGWKFGNTFVDSSYTISTNLNLTAQWTKVGDVSPVTFNVVDGYYDDGQQITLSCETKGATIYYTTDGSDPRTSSTKITYTTSTQDLTLKNDEKHKSLYILAYASKDGLVDSAVSAAIYNLKTYTVTYNNNNHGSDTPLLPNKIKGEVITLPSLKANGYTFNGWSDGTLSNPTGTYTVNSDVTLSAMWTVINYNVTYENCDSTVINSNKKTVTVEDSFKLADPYKEHYIFNGWYTAQDMGEPSKITEIVNPTEHKTLYAKFTAKEYNISYSLNGGEFSNTQEVPVTYTVEQDVQLSVPFKPGYNFDGWYTDKGLATGKVEGNLITRGTSFGDKLLYAKWTEAGKVSDVTFVGGDANNTIDKGNSVTLTCATEGATIYYSTTDTIEATDLYKYTPNTPITINAETTIKAFATKTPLKQSNITSVTYKVKQYKIKFITEFGSVPSQLKEKGATLTDPALTQQGYTLTGWIKEKATTPETTDVMWDFARDTVSKDVTLIAKWTPNTYEVTFDPSTTGGTEIKKTYSYNEQFAMPSNNSEKDGYVLTWTKESSPSVDSVRYNVGQLVSINDFVDITPIKIYANLDPIHYTINYNLDGGTNPSSATIPSQKVAYDESISLPSYSTYTKEGFTSYNQWKSDDGTVYEAEQNYKLNLSTINDSVVTLTALWHENLPGITNLTASGEDCAVTLNWTNPTSSNFDHVEISYRVDSESKVNPVNGVPLKAETFKVHGLSRNIKYTFTIKTFDKEGFNANEQSVVCFANPLQTLTTTVNKLYNYNGSIGTSGKYVTFGDWPQTIKSPDVTIDKAKGVQKVNELSCYLGNDNCYYVEAVANPHQNAKNFTDNSPITSGETYYFKVEPIIWRVIDNYKYGTDINGDLVGKLLVSEKALSTFNYYQDKAARTITGITIEPNHYVYSDIRCYLNGYENYGPGADNRQSTYVGKGFIHQAFSPEARGLINITTLDNSVRSTFGTAEPENHTWTEQTVQKKEYKNDYACSSTEDKIFLLSKYEVTNTAYGFDSALGTGTTRKRLATDYSRAMGSIMDSDYSTYWNLRSPSTTTYTDKVANSAPEPAKIANVKPQSDIMTSFVDDPNISVVPAIVIDSKQVAQFKPLSIPECGTKAKGKTIYIGVEGSGFTKCERPITLSGDSQVINTAKLDVLSDTFIRITVTVPSIQGTYKISVDSEGATSATGNLIVKPTAQYNTGDLLLKDGTIVPAANVTSSHAANALAVIYTTMHGNAFGVGLGDTETHTQHWSDYPDTSILRCGVYDSKGAASGNASNTVIYTDNITGRDNWEEMQKAHPDVTKANFPFLTRIDDYIKRENLTGKNAQGWFVPSGMELIELYKCKDLVNATLGKLSKKLLGDGTKSQPIKGYWASSGTRTHAFYVNFRLPENHIQGYSQGRCNLTSKTPNYGGQVIVIRELP